MSDCMACGKIHPYGMETENLCLRSALQAERTRRQEAEAQREEWKQLCETEAKYANENLGGRLDNALAWNTALEERDALRERLAVVERERDALLKIGTMRSRSVLLAENADLRKRLAVALHDFEEVARQLAEANVTIRGLL